MRNFLWLAYSASALTFLAGFLRDWMLIQHTSYAKVFFDLLYFSSLAAGFLINAITLGGRDPTPRFVLISTCVTIALASVVGHSILLLSTTAIIVSSIAIVLWIIGAVASRALLRAEQVFVGRLREGVAALGTCTLILAELGLEATFGVGIAIGTAWTLWTSRNHRRAYFCNNPNGSPWCKHLQSLAIGNLASTTILVWALVQNRSSEPIWGSDPTIAVRLSVYLFQVLSIGAVIAVVKMPSLSNSLREKSLTICLASIISASLVALLSPPTAIILVPLLAAVSHYAGVAYLHSNSG